MPDKRLKNFELALVLAVILATLLTICSIGREVLDYGLDALDLRALALAMLLFCAFFVGIFVVSVVGFIFESKIGPPFDEASRRHARLQRR